MLQYTGVFPLLPFRIDVSDKFVIGHIGDLTHHN
jgi:hypothetical protein